MGNVQSGRPQLAPRTKENGPRSQSASGGETQPTHLPRRACRRASGLRLPLDKNGRTRPAPKSQSTGHSTKALRRRRKTWSRFKNSETGEVRAASTRLPPAMPRDQDLARMVLGMKATQEQDDGSIARPRRPPCQTCRQVRYMMQRSSLAVETTDLQALGTKMSQLLTGGSF